MKAYLPILFAVLLGSALSAHVIYADEFKMPFGSEALVDFWVDVIFAPSQTGGIDVRVIQTSLFHYDNILAMPEQFTVTHEAATGGTEIEVVQIKSVYEEMISFPEPEMETQITTPAVTPEIQAKLDEKEAEQARLFEAAIICRYGEGAESVFQAKMDVIVLKEMEYFKHLPYSYQVRELILATEACDAFQESYLYRYAEYVDIAEAQKTDIVPFVLDETDSPLTDPVTQRDLDNEIEKAERFQCSVAGKQRGLCVKASVDTETNYPAGKACQVRPVEAGLTAPIMCPMASFNSYLTTTPNKEQKWDEIQQLVCDSYLVQYANLVERIQAGDEGAELPGWLKHCEITTDE